MIGTRVSDPSGSLRVYALVGLAGGFSSALFGTGGGFVVVPLLIMAAGFSARAAVGTSLAAIVPTACFGVVTFQALGVVEWGPAVLIGLPAIAGTIIGTWAQRRVSSRSLVTLFAVFLGVVAVILAL